VLLWWFWLLVVLLSFVSAVVSVTAGSVLDVVDTVAVAFLF